MNYILALDQGTTSWRAILFDQPSDYTDIRLIRDNGNDVGKIEQ